MGWLRRGTGGNYGQDFGAFWGLGRGQGPRLGAGLFGKRGMGKVGVFGQGAGKARARRGRGGGKARARRGQGGGEARGEVFGRSGVFSA
jgi:hypothetical protein